MEDVFISDNYETIVEKIIETNVKSCTIIGPPGTGKTATIPKAIARRRRKQLVVFVCIPTRTGVKFAHDYIKNNETVSEEIKNRLGTAANSKIDYSNRTIRKIRSFLNDDENIFIENESIIVYCTPGHLENVFRDFLKYIMRFKGKTIDLKFCDYLIVDEVHLGTRQIEMVLKYWNALNSSYRHIPIPKLIKMSATYESEGSVYKYESSDPNKYEAILNYMDDLESLMPSIFNEPRIRYNDIINEIPGIVMMAIEVDSFSESGGVVLVFLPGKKEIENVARRLALLLNDADIKSEIIYAHSSLKEEGIEALKSTKEDIYKWRFILSTPICETSITIPDVVIVIDSMMEKVNNIGSNEVILLQTEFISKKSAEQRAGRTGRTCDGMVIRCCTRDFYDKLQSTKRTEIQRLPITNEILKVMSVNIDPRAFFNEKTLVEINNSKRILSDLCCLRKCGDIYTLTPLGFFVADLPISCRNGAFLANWIKLTPVVFPGIVITVMIEYIETLFRGTINSEIMSNIPLGTLCNVVTGYFNKYPNLTIKKNNIIKYSQKIGVDKDVFYEAIRKIFELSSIVSKKLPVEFCDFDPSATLPILKECVKRCYTKMKYNPLSKKYTNPKSDAEYSLSDKFIEGRDTFHEIVYGIIFSAYGENNKKIELWVPEIEFLPSSLTIDTIEEENENSENDEDENNEDESVDTDDNDEM
jgi:cbb3-type cytochrome oxidase subunit 3